MNVSILQGSNPDTAEHYVRKKFKKFNGMFYPRKKRESKCAAYWVAASPTAQDVMESVYQEVFGQLFPLELAKRLRKERENAPVKLESGAWLEAQRDHLGDTRNALDQLRGWEANGDYQEGEDFFLQLKQQVAFLDGSLCDARSFGTEFEASRVQRLTSCHDVGPDSIGAEFDAIIGFEQHAALSFDCYDPKWGALTGKIEEVFKAGVWTQGSAKAAMTRAGFSAELQAAIAIGAQLNIDGECSWKKGNVGLTLAGECEAFVGARGELAAKLSVDAIKGIDACLKAGGFVGVSATVTGKCNFTYGDETLVGLTATAGVSFGAGATCEVSLKSSIFGPTELKFAADLALGLGTTTSTGVAINFTGIYLAGQNEFRKVVYLPTLAKGYRMDLMTQDTKNLHYLRKCIRALSAEEEETIERMRSFQRVPMEKRSLLM